MRSRISQIFKKLIISGLLVWAPVIVTIMVITFLVDMLDKTLLLLPAAMRPDTLLGFHVPGLGLIVSLFTLLLTGFLAANYLGALLFEFWQNLFKKTPVVRTIYTAVAQVLETILSPQGQAFRKVVMVEWPRRDMWTVAFVTTTTTREINESLDSGDELLNVFVPATPNITSGFLMMVPKHQTRRLDMNVDDALKLVVSLGVVQPTGNPASSVVAKNEEGKEV